MATQQQIMEHVNDFLARGALEGWDLDTALLEWNTDNNQAAVGRLTKTNRKATLKDPNRPKRSWSAYLYFCDDERPKVKTTCESGKVMTELGRRWNLLKVSPKTGDKKRVLKYEQQATEAKQLYSAAIAEYQPPSPTELQLLPVNLPKKRGRKSKPSTDASKPKRGKSGYLYFCADKRATVKADNPELSAKEVTTELARLWKELKADKDRTEELAVYEQLAVVDKKRYQTEMAAVAEPIEAELAPVDEPIEAELVTEPAAVDEPIEAELVTKPIKKRTTYHRFCDENLSGVTSANPDKSKGEIRKMVTAMWKGLSKEEKAAYGDDK